jgi:UDP-2,4-diacetamido-2,4,6-trideoxy-beta-L-altropyranose hydrolase
VIQPRVLIRADGSTQMGLGHIVRMATLASAFIDESVGVTFAVQQNCGVAVDLLTSRGLKVEIVHAVGGTADDATETRQIASALDATLAIVDGYQFDAPYFSQLHDAGMFTCYVDDMFRSSAGCHAVLNNNVHADRASYRETLPPTALLGPRYALLADAFTLARRAVPSPSVTNVLVTMGGSDSTGQTEKVMAALALASPAPLRIRVVLGAANPLEYLARLEAAPRASSHELLIEYGVSDMAARMAWADVAITAGGTTCLELCCVGVPALAIAVADNQLGIVQRYGQLDLMVSLGWHGDVTASLIATRLDALCADASRRVAMVMAQHLTVDGKGKERVARALLEAHSSFAARVGGGS